MSKGLLIVESPAKAKTIEKFLGRRFAVAASMGHVRDLPRSRLAVDPEHGFAPRYITIRGKGPVLAELRERIRHSDRVLLATDPDREGEAISWHLCQALGLPEDEPIRITFHEITKDAVRRALASPRPINDQLVLAQQARRILDRLVGYKLSPLLWKKVRGGLSAGRVQSVAVRLIVDREQERQRFQPEEYWSLAARLTPRPISPPVSPSASRPAPAGEQAAFSARYVGPGGQRAELKTQAQVKAVMAEVEGRPYRVARVQRRERKRNPAGPFTTATLQQEASRKLGFGVARTMRVAQQLYEGLPVGGQHVGLVTYIRTDSVRVAEQAQGEAAAYVRDRWGSDYAQPRAGSAKAGAQDAHEAIRPTSVGRTPESLRGALTRDQLRLYRLIWERFLASQMAPAVYDTVTADIVVEGREAPAVKEPAPQGSRALGRTTAAGDGGARAAKGATAGAAGGPGGGAAAASGKAAGSPELPRGAHVFRATGSTIKFPGFMTVYVEGKDEQAKTAAGGAEPDEDEERTLPELQEGQALRLLALDPAQHFTEPPPRFTEAMLVKALEEQGIGRPSTYAPIIETVQHRGYVARAERRLVPTELGVVVTDLLKQYFPNVVDAAFTAGMEAELDQVEAGQRDWQSVLGDFYGPFAELLQRAEAEIGKVEVAEPVVTDEVCERCGRPMAVRHGRFGPFLACTGYPECKNTRPILQKVGVACPRCGGDLVVRRSRRGRTFYGCSRYPECDYVAWERPVGPCPVCGDLMVEKRGRQGGRWAQCLNVACDHREPLRGAGGEDGDGVAVLPPEALAKRGQRAAREAGGARGSGGKRGGGKPAPAGRGSAARAGRRRSGGARAPAAPGGTKQSGARRAATRNGTIRDGAQAAGSQPSAAARGRAPRARGAGRAASGRGAATSRKTAGSGEAARDGAARGRAARGGAARTGGARSGGSRTAAGGRGSAGSKSRAPAGLARVGRGSGGPADDGGAGR